jgi:hypothetical protein
MPAGRPRILTPEVLEQVRHLLPVVLYLETVGDFLGVERTTWRKWLKRGAKEARRLRNPRSKPKAAEAIYLEFFHTYKKGLAEGEMYDLTIIRKASAGQWQAAAWRLERRFPERWGRKDRHDVNVKNVERAIEAELARLAGQGETSDAGAPAGQEAAPPAGRDRSSAVDPSTDQPPAVPGV